MTSSLQPVVRGAGVGCGVNLNHSHMQSMEYVLLLIQVTTHFIWILLGPQ